MFSKNYKLYFHKVNDSNWGLNSYMHISNIKEKDDLYYLYKKITNYTSGMFFLMNEDVKPIYEDKKNICLIYCNNKLTNKEEDSELITGISISPKINNCIFKIWISRSVKVDILKDDIKFLELKNAMYRNHLNNL